MSMPMSADMNVPVDMAFVHSVPTGTEFAATDEFFLSLLQHGGLLPESRVAFHSANGEKVWDGNYRNRDKAVGCYRSIAAQSGRTGSNITVAVDDARRWLLTCPPTDPNHRRLLVLIAPEKAWSSTGAEGQDFDRLLHYKWDGARDGLIEVVVIGIPEAQKPKVLQAWQGRLKIAPRLFDLEHDLSLGDLGLVKPKHG